MLDIERCLDIVVLSAKFLQIQIIAFGKPFVKIRNRGGSLGTPESIFSRMNIDHQVSLFALYCLKRFLTVLEVYCLLHNVGNINPEK